MELITNEIEATLPPLYSHTERLPHGSTGTNACRVGDSHDRLRRTGRAI